MSARRRLAVAAATVAAGVVAAGVLAAPAGAAAAAPQRAQTLATPVVKAVMISPQGVTYTRLSNGTHFNWLGGTVDSTPALLPLPNGDTWYFGHSPNGILYVRSVTQGWRPAADSSVHCWNPAAALLFRHPAGDPSSTLYAYVVACRGDGNHLVTIDGTDITNFPHWTSSNVVDEGGVIMGGGGPAVVATGADYNYLAYVVGGSYGSGNVYATQGGAAATYAHVNEFCLKTPAVNAGGTPSHPDPSPSYYIACSGTPASQMVYAISSDGVHFGPLHAGGGQINEPVGLAVRPDGASALAYVQGEFNHVLYVETISATGVSGYTNLGGQIIDGVKAGNLG